MKRAIAIILCAVMVMSLCGCGESVKPTKSEIGEGAPRLMTVVDKTAGYTIYKHDQTGVCYFCRNAGYGQAIFVMLNPDGTPYVWEAHNGE